MEPILGGTGMPHTLASVVYSRLLQPYWKESRNDFVFVPELAERWEISKDGLTTTFHLRKGAKFHNVAPTFGREVTSADVKYSMERAAYDPASLFQVSFRNVASMETPDKYTFVMKLKEFDAELLPFLAQGRAWIYAKEVLDKFGNLKTTAIGSGPFIFDKWVKDIGVFYRRSPDYYLPGQPYLDNLVLLILRDEQTRLTAFRTGRSCCLGAEIEVFKDLQKTNPGLQWEKSLITDTNVIGMKYGHPLFNDIRVRKAIFLAVDLDSHLKVAREGAGQWRAPVSGQHGNWALSQEELRKLKPYDPATSKKLLAEAGVKPGLVLEMLHNGTYPVSYQNKVQRFIEEMRDIGITLKLDTYEHPTFRRKQDAGDYKDLILGPDGQPSAEAHLVQNYRCGGNKNMMQLCDSKLDARIDKMVTIVDPEDRRQEALNIQRFLMENYYYKIPMLDYYQYSLQHPWVKGLKEAPPHYSGVGFEHVWLTEAAPR